VNGVCLLDRRDLWSGVCTSTPIARNFSMSQPTRSDQSASASLVPLHDRDLRPARAAMWATLQRCSRRRLNDSGQASTARKSS